jgi:hypothetical protein
VDWGGLGMRLCCVVEAKTVFSDVIPQARVSARLWGGEGMIILCKQNTRFFMARKALDSWGAREIY